MLCFSRVRGFLQDGREELLKELEKKKALHQKLSAELERYKSCDPERVEELRECSHWTHIVCLLPTAAQWKLYFYLKEVQQSFHIHIQVHHSQSTLWPNRAIQL